MSEDDPRMLAGEYVLRLLGATDHATAERRLAADPAFAAEVQAWEARLAPLVEAVTEVAPPARAWPAIAARLGASVVPIRPRGGAWNNIALWRATTAAAALLAAASFVLAILPRPPAPAPPPATAAIARLEVPKGGTSFIATLDEARGQLVVTPAGQATPAGRSAQLWLMPSKGMPVSLGVFTGRNTLVVVRPAGVTAGSTLGVSLEPQGGSPTGQPTGPVIAVGQLMRL